MPRALDQIADANRAELTRFARLYTFPDFVKRADIERALEPRPVTVNLYADPVRRQFPCDDAASTWLSALYFLDKQAEFHPKDQASISHRLEHYVNYWQIKRAYAVLTAAHTALHKTADDQLPDSAFAWVWTDEDTGARERRLRLTNAMEVKAAADWLVAYRDRMPFDVRHKIATRVKEAQLKFGASLGKNADFVERQAGRGVCQPAEVVQMLRRRVDMTKDAAIRQQLQKLAATVAAAPKAALQPTMLVKLANTVDMIDRSLGLIGQYNDFIQRPEDVIFSVTFEKAASEVCQHVATVTGAVFQKEALGKLALSDVRDLLGEDFAERVRSGFGLDGEKFAEELVALPYHEARMIESLLSDAGVAPVMKKAASVRVGFNHAQLQKLAAQY